MEWVNTNEKNFYSRSVFFCYLCFSLEFYIERHFYQNTIQLAHGVIISRTHKFQIIYERRGDIFRQIYYE